MVVKIPILEKIQKNDRIGYVQIDPDTLIVTDNNHGTHSPNTCLPIDTDFNNKTLPFNQTNESNNNITSKNYKNISTRNICGFSNDDGVSC